ncbi:MAG: hypothetical protein M0Z80_05070 [Treponema sp.]|nr:hypothetical protein [Treponema sp.]
MIPHPESVSPELLEIARSLAAMEELRGAALGGGTSLVLVFGHRKSIYIDYFLADIFDPIGLQEALVGLFPDIAFANRTAGSLCARIGTVKLDILLHSHPLLRKYARLDALQCLSLPDMAAMEANAVANRGSRKVFRIRCGCTRTA